MIAVRLAVSRDHEINGSTDVIARVVTEYMRGSLKQPIIIENITGADGSVGVGRAAHAAPDGYTISIGHAATHVLNGALYSLQYDLLNDFAPISLLATAPLILFGRKTMPAKDLRELIVWLKINPNKASAGYGAAGSHLLAAFFRRETGTQFTLVPYRGGAPATQDLVAGQIDLQFNTPDALPLARTGTIKVYAVTSDTRMAFAPDIPTFREIGLTALSYSQWTGLFAPKGTPREIISKLNAAAVEALPHSAVRSRLVEMGQEIFPRDQQTPEALGALQKADVEKWWPLIKEFGIKAE